MHYVRYRSCFALGEACLRYWIGLILGCTVGFSAAASPAQAGPREDCNQRTDHDLAIRACSDLIRSNPRDALALSNRGNSYRMKRDYERAIVDLDKAVRLNPYYARAFGRRGAAYRLKGDYDRAIWDTERGDRLDPPGYVMAHTERGIGYRMKGEYDRAIADLNQAIRLDPRFDFAFAGYHLPPEGRLHACRRRSQRGCRFNPRNSYAATELSLAKLSPSTLGPPLAPPKPMVVAPPKAPVETLPFASSIAPPPSVALGRRVALAIGNAAYRHAQALPNPRKDAGDVAAALKAAGFVDMRRCSTTSTCARCRRRWRHSSARQREPIGRWSPAHSPNFIKPNGRFKMILTVIKSGYE